MRFRPANISLINRRHYLPRLLLTFVLESTSTTKTTPAIAGIDRSHHIRDNIGRPDLSTHTNQKVNLLALCSHAVALVLAVQVRDADALRSGFAKILSLLRTP